LLTTPESLEVMLVSPNVDARILFQDLRAVIVDEIHAFAGDDRGWHLLSVLQRITRLAGRELQRIGLSATVGNPEKLTDWLAAGCQGKRRVIQPRETALPQADVKLDFVGSLQNAAIVISRLHRGEKRLVFVDSRAQAEQLGAELRHLHVTTFVTHSSLSQDQRRQAEEAFANRDDCAIVATSVLELGIDVGNLDRVIQIDSPATVSGFLQRMGRTGRREGTIRNCLFLATRDESLLQAAALIDLWSTGYVEPIQPPREPYHILAQQLMALVLQEQGVGKSVWFDWVRGVSAFAEMPAQRIEQIVTWMLERELLWDEQGILGIGPTGEERFGRRNFLELLSVFLSPPLFAVLHGSQELGFVDELTFLGKQDGPRTLLLGGRAWRVNHVDWQRKIAYVDTSEDQGRSRWKGSGRGLGFRLCQAIKGMLASDRTRDWWSQRAQDRIVELRCEFPWLSLNGSVVVVNDGAQAEWWTFAGYAANACLVPTLAQATQSRITHDSLALRFEQRVTFGQIERAIEELWRHDVTEILPSIDEAAVNGLKFAECLPLELAMHVLQMRTQDAPAIEQLQRQAVHYVTF
jgi:ATP-dependent Lhr-like helicase